MAIEKEPSASPDPAQPEITGIDLTMAEDIGNPGRPDKRDAAGATVRPTGLARMNRNGTDLLDALAKSKGFEPNGYKLKLGGDAKTGFIGLYPVDLTVPSAVDISRNKKDNIITVYLHGLFKKVQGLRPAEVRKCKAVIGTDAKGTPCMLLNVKSATVKY